MSADTRLFRSSRQIRRRAGMASMEAVITLGLVFPFAVIIFVIGVRICQLFWHVVGTLVGWPYI